MGHLGWGHPDGARDTVGPPVPYLPLISHGEITTSLPEIVISLDVVPLGRRVRCAFSPRIPVRPIQMDR